MPPELTCKFLLINYYFPPIKSVAVLRNFHLQRELQQLGYTVHIITTKNRDRLLQDPLPLEVASLQPVRTLDYRTLASLGRHRGTHFSEKQKTGWKQWLIKINDSFPFNLFLGEGGLVYILSGFLTAIRLIQQQQISHVYSSFRPAADHVIAYLLTLFFPKKIKWIADFRDLHVDPIYRHVIWEKFQHWVWRKMLKRAHLVTTVSEGLAKHLCRYHPQVHVMRNGIGGLTSQAVETEHFDKFSIAYTGSMFKNERDPRLLLEALQQLVNEGILPQEKIQIVYAGKDGTTWQRLSNTYQLGHLLTDRGLESHTAAIRLQRSAQINLLLTSSHPELTGVLTGKFCEYLAAGRPVLCIINGPTDPEFEEIFSTTQAGLVAYNQPGDLSKVKSFIMERYREWEAKGDVACAISPQRIAPFKWENIAAELVGKLSLPVDQSTGATTL